MLPLTQLRVQESWMGKHIVQFVLELHLLAEKAGGDSKSASDVVYVAASLPAGYMVSDLAC
jgi:hypothetical protein